MPLGLCFPFPCNPKCKCNEPKVQSEPLYTEYLSVLQEETPTLGIDGLNWFDTMYPKLFTQKSRLVYRFNKHYQFREISREDTTVWMKLLQDRFDEIADKYNHAYSLYDNPDIDLDKLGVGYKRTIDYENSRTGSSTSSTESSGNAKFRDTPTNEDSTINNPTTENVDTSESSGESSNESSGEGTTTEIYEYNDRHIVDDINELIAKYKQLDEDFIREFEQMFIGIIAEWC